MSARYSFIITIIFALLLCSCQKKELPVRAHDPGNVTTATVDIGYPYKYQVYFNLRTNAAVSQVLKTSWDIGFEVSAGGYHIVLNSAKSMFVLKTAKTDFTDVKLSDTVGFSVSRRWDEASGNMDSTAIGDWRDSKPVFILDRGYNENGAPVGLQKIQLLSVTDSNYTIRFAALNGTGDTTISIVKDSTYNLAFLSFTTRQQTIVEPPKSTWDISFSQYTYIFYDYDPPMPYLVTGCLLNRNNTTAIRDTATAFNNISYSNTGAYHLSSDITTIGYEWKVFSGSGYTVNTKYNYVIKTAEGIYYKLHFTGYYNASGKQGNPKWEYQQL